MNDTEKIHKVFVGIGLFNKTELIVFLFPIFCISSANNNIERIKPKYFYSVNRAKERKDKYNAGGFYNLNFNKRWKSVLYGYTHTYHIEFLGEFIGE